MSTKEANRLHIIKLVENRTISLKKASEEMGVSVRHGKRIYKRYKEEGEVGLISKRRGRPSTNKTPLKMKERILKLIKTKYPDFGPTFACEKLKEKHHIRLSVETLRQLMIKDGIWIAKKKKSLQIHQRRARRSRFGELIQIDGSYHDWFEGRGPKCCLLVFVDDATSKILYLHFCKTETTFDYLYSFRNYVQKYGKPLSLYSDRHSIFRVNQGNETGKKLTNFSTILKGLDVDLICANSPQAKGRVERANGILQDRFIKEMRLKGISTIEEANQYIPTFIKKYNKNFGKHPINLENAHRKLTKNSNLDRLFAIKKNRKLSKNLSFQYKGAEYHIKIKKPSYSMRNASIIVLDYGLGKIEVEYKDKKLEYSKWQEYGPQPGRIVDSKQLNWVDKKRTKPGLNHPWL